MLIEILLTIAVLVASIAFLRFGQAIGNRHFARHVTDETLSDD